MNANNKPEPLAIYYQEVDLLTVLGTYVKGFQPPAGSVVKWDANIDSTKGKVWFKLWVEAAAPVETKNIITLKT